MFDKHLVHAIIGGKDPDCGSAELSVNLVLTRGHGSLLLDLLYVRGVSHSEAIHLDASSPSRGMTGFEVARGRLRTSVKT